MEAVPSFKERHENCQRSGAAHFIAGLRTEETASATGLKSRSRRRAVERREEDTWVNRAILLLRDLWHGRLSRSLLATNASEVGESPAGSATGTSSKLIAAIRSRIRAVLGRKPPGLPQGAAALVRQRGVGAHPGPRRPEEGARRTAKLPNRGDIWPAVVEDISLPPAGTEPIPISEVSPHAGSYLKSFREKMMLPVEEVEKEDTEAYVDPAISAQMLELALRMSEAKMLRGVKRAECTVGMFTVVKKVVPAAPGKGSPGCPDYQILLRLVFDQRGPNRRWKEPPWIALGGPGALANLDLSRIPHTEEQVVKLWSVAGDIPDWYYRLAIPEDMIPLFCLPDVKFSALLQALRDRGRHLEAEQLEAETPEAQDVGLRVLLMGWNWAVFLAQCCLRDILSRIPGPRGQPLLQPEQMLVEGAPPRRSRSMAGWCTAPTSTTISSQQRASTLEMQCRRRSRRRSAN